MVTKTTERRERLEARVTAEVKDLIQYAADIEGRTLSDFLVGSAVAAARDSIQTNQVLKLSRRDSVMFHDLLANPPEPNEKLRNAFAEYRKAIGKD